MLVITVRLLHGTIRAGSADDTAMATAGGGGEWPPSPARVFSALVAADGTGERCQVTDGTELRTLENLGAPVIQADHDVETSNLRPRYVVVDKAGDGTVQNYPGRSSTEVHPGTKMSPRTPRIHYVWSANLEPHELAALKRRAARIGYLGCADSPVQVSVGTAPPAGPETSWVPGTGTTELPVAYPGFLDELDRAFASWSAGEAMRRSWIPTQREHYGLATEAEAEATQQPTVIWLELERPLASWKVLRLTEALRAAVLDQADRLAPEGPLGQRAPWQLHGHSIPEQIQTPYQLVRYLALPNVGHEHSDGAIHGAAVWIPPATQPATVELIRRAVAQIKRLTSPGISVGIAVRGGAGGKRSTQPARWIGPSQRWFSATPVVAERGRRSGPSPSDVRDWFVHAGYPAPAVARISPVPSRPGVARLSGKDVHRSDRDRHPFFWLDVKFVEPVAGPLCIGRSRSFGLGLLAPLPDHQPSVHETRR